MAGLILYSVNPRSLGTLPEWTVALMEAEKLGCNAIHLNPFHPVTAASKNYHGAQVSGSLYAIRDHFTINEEFCGGLSQVQAFYQLRDFMRMARAKKMRVLADLVFNHVAIDHPLVAAHANFFRHDADGKLHVPGPADDPWTDIAQIDYNNAEAWNYFLGESGYWLRLIDEYLDIGFSGFRCDAVYWLPQLVWERALNHALVRSPDTLILAETLGLSGQDAELMSETLRESDARLVYDICYDDVGRTWDNRDIPALKNSRKGRMDVAARDGAMGFVDSHDFKPRAAELRKQYGAGAEADAKIAAICLRDYAVACFTNDSVMLPRGYQWCVEDHVGPFREQVNAEFYKALKLDRKHTKSAFTLGPSIAEMHRIRSQLPPSVTVEFSRVHIAGHEGLTAMQCDYTPAGGKTPATSIIMLLNIAPEKGAVKFPEEWWKEFKGSETGALRFQFGADRNHREQISGVALLLVPGGLKMQRHHNPSNVAALKGEAPPEPALVA